MLTYLVDALGLPQTNISHRILTVMHNQWEPSVCSSVVKSLFALAIRLAAKNDAFSADTCADFVFTFFFFQNSISFFLNAVCLVCMWQSCFEGFTAF